MSKARGLKPGKECEKYIFSVLSDLDNRIGQEPRSKTEIKKLIESWIEEQNRNLDDDPEDDLSGLNQTGKISI